MPLSALEANTIARAVQVSKRLLEEIKPILDRLNIIYDAPGTGANATITQAELDEAAQLSGLTKAELDNAMNALTFQVLPALSNGYTALATLAARG